MALVLKPGVDMLGRDVTYAMLTTCIDVNGSVPKWLVNFVAASAPGQWFADC